MAKIKILKQQDSVAVSKDDLTDHQAILLIDGSFQPPPQTQMEALLFQPVDVWHAGLSLGMQGLPRVIDFVQPMWMLNRDADPAIESTSWRVSSQACLIRTDVIKKMGWLAPGFKTAEAAFLEMSHRWMTNGVLMRHVPELISEKLKVKSEKMEISFEDELRFVYYRFGEKWALWSLGRSVMNGIIPVGEGMEVLDRVIKTPRPEEPKPYRNNVQRAVDSGLKSEGRRQKMEDCMSGANVSVLIPTLHRYPYLRTVLDQLRRQTVKPLEIIIVDQSRKELRDMKIAADFKDLPLKMIYQDEAGQCASRNAGLKMSQGTHILFIDDDDEVTPTLIEDHLNSMSLYQCEVSSGVANEVGIPDLPKNFKYLRQSDVFPTNNTMIKKEVLKKSGIFDLAYNRKQRADGDLGMRVHLSGAQMILNPDISVLHHHAAEGGLRQHKARKITYAASRNSIWVRHLPSDSEIYLGLRYFTRKQVREFLWHKAIGTFSVHGNIFKKLAKSFIGCICLPHTIFEMKKRYKSAEKMLKRFPEIPTIE